MNIIINKNTYNKEYLVDRYSKYCIDNEKIEGIPYINFPFEINDIHEEFKYLSWILLDHDSNPVVQFSWIHWLVSNYPIEEKSVSIPENLKNTLVEYTKGVNSFAGPVTNIKNEDIILNYGGPTPPDKDHLYTLAVYSHDKKLNLEDGFYYNNLLMELEKVNYEKDSIKILSRS